MSNPKGKRFSQRDVDRFEGATVHFFDTTKHEATEWRPGGVELPGFWLSDRKGQTWRVVLSVNETDESPYVSGTIYRSQ